jgi:hypothetical protein
MNLALLVLIVGNLIIWGTLGILLIIDRIKTKKMIGG